MAARQAWRRARRLPRSRLVAAAVNRVEAALRRIAVDLDSRGQRWALVGGFAISARAEPRFTRDVDVVVVVEDDEAAEHLVRSLTAAGYRLGAVVEQDAVGRLATARLTSPGTGAADVVIDLIFASSGIEPEIAGAAERIEIMPGVTLPVARAGHLVALKLLARDDQTRPQDLADLRALLPALTGPDRDDARRAIELIMTRGYSRGRPLPALLRHYLGGQ